MRYILFGEESCPYCALAISILDEKGLSYNVIDFEPGQKDILDDIKRAYDWKTVPMIFLREGNDIKFIGGYSDLIIFFDEK